MPKVGTKHFPYTEEGVEQAKKERKKQGKKGVKGVKAGKMKGKKK